MKLLIRLSLLIGCLLTGYPVFADSENPAQLETTPPPAEGAISADKTPPILQQAVKPVTAPEKLKAK